MNAIAAFVNDHKKKGENLQKVIEISEVVSGCSDLVTPARIFIRDMDADEKDHSGKLNHYHYWLFNDMIMWGKANGQKKDSKGNKRNIFTFKGKISFEESNIISDLKASSFMVTNDINKSMKPFMIVCKSKDFENWDSDIKTHKKTVEENFKHLNLSRTNTTEGELAPRRKNSAISSIETRYSGLVKRASNTELPMTENKLTSSDENSSSDEPKTRDWKKLSTSQGTEIMKALNEEKRKRQELADWKKQHLTDVDKLQVTIKEKDSIVSDKDVLITLLKQQVEELKNKIVVQAIEINDNSVIPEKQRSTTVVEKGSTEDSSKYRNWNKKVIYDLQDSTRELGKEKKARLELEEWKREAEKTLEEMRKKKSKLKLKLG